LAPPAFLVGSRVSVACESHPPPPLNTRALGGVLEDVHMAVTDSLLYPRVHALFP
jgi:hypothetical protein